VKDVQQVVRAFLAAGRHLLPALEIDYISIVRAAWVNFAAGGR
jgi:hypothetical protein